MERGFEKISFEEFKKSVKDDEKLYESINLPIRDVLSLRVGDVIRLSNIKVGDPLSLSVGNEKKFYCQPGVVGKKMAVQITGKVENVESDEFEELSVEGDETYE